MAKIQKSLYSLFVDKKHRDIKNIIMNFVLDEKYKDIKGKYQKVMFQLKRNTKDIKKSVDSCKFTKNPCLTIEIIVIIYIKFIIIK
jgi:hypothetical protein